MYTQRRLTVSHHQARAGMASSEGYARGLRKSQDVPARRCRGAREAVGGSVDDGGFLPYVWNFPLIYDQDD